MNAGPEKSTAGEGTEDVWAVNVISCATWLWRKYIIYVQLRGKLWNASAGRNGKPGFFHFWYFLCFRKWQVTFQWEHSGFCYQIYNPPKKFMAMWKNVEISLCSLSPNLYPVTWSCTLLWGRQIWKAFCKGKRVHFFLCTVILSFDYPPSKYVPKHFMKYFSYNPYYFGYVYLHPALMSAQWNLMKLPTFVIGMTEHGCEALCMTLFISFLFSVVCTFGYWMFCNVLTLWSLRD